MIIEVGILNSKIKTEDKKLLSQIVELYSYKQPGYDFTPAYRRRAWDGNKNFVTKSGSFRTGLLSRILADLKKIDLIPDIKYQYTIDWVNQIKLIDKFNLYDFQLNATREALSCGRAVIQSPTGSGKSLIMATIVNTLKDKKGVILFNSIQLVTQFYKFLQDCGIEAGICFGNNFIYNDIMLCTVQSIDKILDTHLEEAEFLMVDEVHEFCKGKVTLEAIQSFPKAQFRFGFTATVPSEEFYKLNLEGAIGPVIRTQSTADLVTGGFLTKPIIQIVDLPDVDDSDFDLTYQETYQQFIVENENRNKIIANIVNSISENNKKARILVLVESLKHIDILKELFPCFTLQGKDDISTRYNTIHKFLNSKCSSVLIGSNILQTGVNIEEISHMVMARGMKSEIAVIQALGRALRKHETKERVFVYDFFDKAPYLRVHSKHRIKYYKREGHEVEII